MTCTVLVACKKNMKIDSQEESLELSIEPSLEPSIEPSLEPSLELSINSTSVTGGEPALRDELLSERHGTPVQTKRSQLR